MTSLWLCLMPTHYISLFGFPALLNSAKSLAETVCSVKATHIQRISHITSQRCQTYIHIYHQTQGLLHPSQAHFSHSISKEHCCQSKAQAWNSNVLFDFLIFTIQSVPETWPCKVVSSTLSSNSCKHQPYITAHPPKCHIVCICFWPWLISPRQL